MDKSNLKKYILIVTYAIVLFLGLSNIEHVIKALFYVLGILSPLIIGICITFVLNILMKLYEERVFKNLLNKKKVFLKYKRVICIILTYVSVALFITVLVRVISPQVSQSTMTLIQRLPEYAQKGQEWIMQFCKDMGWSDNIWNELMAAWNQFEFNFSQFATDTAFVLFDFTVGFTTGVLNFFIGFVFSIYMLYSKEKLIGMLKKLCYAIMKNKYADKVIEIAHEANVTFARFIGGQITEAVILGVLCFIGMIIIRIPYAPLISVIIGITSLIPIIGAFIGTIPAALIILMEDPIKALIFVIFIIVLQQIEGDFIYPRVVGNAIGIDGFWVFVAITVGGSIGGIMGMLIGVPLTALIYSVVRQFTYHRLKKKGIRVTTEIS